MDHAAFNERRRTVRLAEGELAYADVGDGPPALFVHGVFTSSHLWRNVISGLADVRRCIAIDLPAHGRTEMTLADVSLPAQAELLRELCDALELDEVDVVANDTGGALVQIFAANHPHRLRTLTLTNCDVQDQIPPEAFQPAFDAAAQGELAPALAEVASDLSRARDTPLRDSYERIDDVPDETIREFLGGFADLDRAREIERIVLSLRPADLMAVEPRLAKLEVPTLIVWGTGDLFFDLKWAHWLRDTIPGAQAVVEVPGARLFYPDERPEELIPHIREHWAAHAEAQPAAIG